MPGRPIRTSPGAGPRAASQWRPRQRGSASRQPSSGTPTRGHATSCRRAQSRPPRLDTVEGGGRAPEPVFPPGAGPGATPRRGHGDRGVGSDRARHGMQVDHCGRPATHAIACGVPQPPTGGPPLSFPSRPHKGSLEGHAEPPQGVDDDSGCTVPARAGAGAAHGPHTRGPPRPAYDGDWQIALLKSA